MRRACIVSPVRTAVGTFGGALRSVPVEELSAVVIRAILERTGLAPEKIEEVVFAHGYPSGETPNLGRLAALQAGLPLETAGLQVDRRCGGGLQSIITAAMMVQTGAADVVVAGGAESMSNVEYYTTDMRWGKRGWGGRGAVRPSVPWMGGVGGKGGGNKLQILQELTQLLNNPSQFLSKAVRIC